MDSDKYNLMVTYAFLKNKKFVPQEFYNVFGESLSRSDITWVARMYRIDCPSGYPLKDFFEEMKTKLERRAKVS